MREAILAQRLPSVEPFILRASFVSKQGKHLIYGTLYASVESTMPTSCLFSWPLFGCQYIAWTDEGKQTIGGVADVCAWRQRGTEAWLEECVVLKFEQIR